MDTPEDYDTTYLSLSRRGARVLALGWRNLGSMTLSSLRDLKRENVESELQFAGFVIISCPLKPDSKSVIKELVGASHKVTMITGDNPLTACHVAKQLRFSRNPTTLILSSCEEGGGFEWKSVDGQVILPLDNPKDIGKAKWREFIHSYDLCVTGEGLTFLQNDRLDLAHSILPHVRVFARVNPKQKESVITTLKYLGYHTLMCGDGTNDVGALKHAHVGVAILSSNPPRRKKEKAVAVDKPEAGEGDKFDKLRKEGKGKRSTVKSLADQRVEKMTARQQQLQKMMKELQEAEEMQVNNKHA